MATPLQRLRAASTLHEVATILGFQPKHLSYLIYIKPEPLRYKTFDIPKRGGGSRPISAPADDLKLLQRKLADILMDCVEEIQASKNLRDNAAHGFLKHRSIVTNAYPHTGRRYIFNLDLTDFFGSITFPRLYGFFQKDTGFALPKKVATILAQIACKEGRLPQGSPCSPVISHLIGHILDVHLVRLAARYGCRYTRYADDLTFSTNKRTFPAAIAKQTIGDPHKWEPGKSLSEIIDSCGFRINEKKIRMQYRSSLQQVTGLTVNKKLNVSTDYRHRVRAMVHSVLKTGKFYVDAPELSGPGISVVKQRPGNLHQLHGMLGFIDSVDLFNHRLVNDNRHNYFKRLVERLSSKETMFQRFLLYRFFWATERPLIVCEGKTDNVYMTHAIRSLAASFPQLATVAASGKVELNVRLFKYTNSSTGRILGNPSGGTAGLCSLMRTYKKESEKFSAPGPLQPFIILVDNDTGATDKKKIYDTISQLTGKPKPTGAEPFVRVYKNMYVVPTPKSPGSATSCIEDFFQAKDKVFNGKTFDPNCEQDTNTTFGKATFAFKVVEAHPEKIDFTLFDQLLENICAAMSDFVSHK